MIWRSCRSSTTQSSFGRSTAVRFPVSASLMNMDLFHTQRPTYFSFIRMVRTVETAQPRRVGPRRVTLAGKATPSSLRPSVIAFMLNPAAYSRKIRRTISASGWKMTQSAPSAPGSVR